MFQPAVLNQSGANAATLFSIGSSPITSANVFHLCGALVVVTSVIAMGEVLRAARTLNLLLAALVGIAPWLASGETLSALLGSLGALTVAALSLPKGPIREQYGSWNRRIV